MQKTKCFLVHFLCFLMAWTPTAIAAPPERSPEASPENAKGPSNSARTTVLGAMIIRRYQQFKTPAELVDVFSVNRPESEREIMKKKIHSFGNKLPKIKPAYTGVTLYEGSYYLRIDLRRAAQRIVTFNGHEMEIDPQRPLPEVAEELLIRLQSVTAVPSNAPLNWFSLLVPRAQAMNPVLLGILAFIGAQIAQQATTRTIQDGLDALGWEGCNYIMETSFYAQNPYICKEFKGEKGKLVADAQLRNSNPAKRTIAVIVESEICPHEMPEGKEPKYESNIIIIKKVGDTSTTKAPVGEKFKVSGATAGANLKTIDLLREEKNTKGEVVPIIVASYSLDPNGAIQEIKVPNPDANSSKKKVIQKGVRGIPAIEVKEKNLEPTVLVLTPAADYRSDPQKQGLMLKYEEIKYNIDLRMKSCNSAKEQTEAKKLLEVKGGTIEGASKLKPEKAQGAK